ncbi:SpoIIE family protein phosphatase [Chloracidobacterium validum]|uniref:SpoIIE family protein phosphatase n=1 Tax=Chloracidobacterium validum TaxID=2821543 RepID=A0ABX8BBG1_9BACT|nr:SpoIIE family protein phosphatase [Chloracidobacterium validum]QUW04269.1 SpoIIE family protein phosphatase [Chloracidobacterium validum]
MTGTSCFSRIWLGLLLVWLLGMPGLGQPSPTAGSPNLDQPITLYTWKYRSGDDPAWAAPGLNDTDWLPLNLAPGPTFSGGPRLGVGWYRTEVSVADLYRPGVRVNHVLGSCAYEVYVNGVRVGQFGEVTPRPRFPPGRFHLPMAIPAEALRPDGHLVVAIRAQEQATTLGNDLAFLGAQVGTYDYLAGQVFQARAEATQRDIFRISFVFAFAFFALYHLYLYASFTVFQKNRKERTEYLWLALIALGYAVNSFSISHTLTDNTSIQTYRLINAISVHFQLICGAEFIYSFLKRPVPKWVRGHQISQIICLVGTIAFPDQLLLPVMNEAIFSVSVLSLVAPVTVHIVHAAYRGVSEARALRMSISLILIAECIQVAQIALRSSELSESVMTRWLFYPVFRYAVDFSFGIFLLSMAVNVARRYRNEIESINRNLEQTVAERTTQVRYQRDELERKNQDIEDSLRYAQTMQQAILPTLGDLQSAFAEAFVLWKSRDIVSGDFYWFHKTETGGLLAVADCTGHGVPGAFMSFIGNDLLNQIVIERGIADPARILTELDQGVRRILKQGHAQSVGLDDGMDVGICRFDAGSVTFAGARRPLYVVADGEVTTHAGARHPIGGRLRKAREFENVAIPVAPQAMLYLTTDGFADQPDAGGRRFKTHALLRCLQDIAPRPATEQQARLEAALAAHAGATPQRDDITVVGVRLDPHRLDRLNGGADRVRL